MLLYYIPYCCWFFTSFYVLCLNLPESSQNPKKICVFPVFVADFLPKNINHQPTKLMLQQHLHDANSGRQRLSNGGLLVDRPKDDVLDAFVERCRKKLRKAKAQNPGDGRRIRPCVLGGKDINDGMDVVWLKDVGFF